MDEERAFEEVLLSRADSDLHKQTLDYLHVVALIVLELSDVMVSPL